MTSNLLRATSDLFSAGEDRGLITLPETLVKARDVLRRVSATHPELPEDTEADAIFRAARTVVSGGGIDPSGVIACRAAVTAYTVSAEIRREAVAIAEREFSEVYRNARDLLITKHLRPAHRDVCKELLSLWPKVADLPNNNEVLLRMAAPVRAAWLRSTELLESYALLLSIRYQLVKEGPRPAHDDHGYFTEVRDPQKADPRLATDRGIPYVQGIPASAVPTTGTRDRFGYYARAGCEFWMPTVAEQDAEYQKLRGPFIAALQHFQNAGKTVKAG